MPRLTLKFKDNPIALFNLEEGRSLTIGRKNSNDVVINNLAVSGHHAKIDSVGDGFVFIDLKSKNGSFVNEELVSSHWLRNGDVISIGKHALVFSYSEDELQPEEQPSEMDKTMVMDTSQYRAMMEKSKPKPPPPPSKSPQRQDEFMAYIASSEGAIKLKSKITTIGKDPSCDIPLKGLFAGKTAATINKTAKGYVLSYVSGLSKPKVNEQRILGESVHLKDSDIIEIGSNKLQFLLRKIKK
jgi:pSer/pThr/pTyr-binding forkhead associated (FHA) protein